MAASTLEELGDDLDRSLHWRRTELAALKTQIERLRPTEETLPLGRAILRGSVTLMYAHWEGFTKDALQAYVDFVAIRRLGYADLSDAFACLSLEWAAERLTRREDIGRKHLIDLVRTGPSMRARIPRSEVVVTESNLRFAVLERILTRMGLETSAFATRSQWIDRSLCDQRNEVAHGKDNFPRAGDVLSLHSDLIPMLEHVRDLVLDAASQGRYRS